METKNESSIMKSNICQYLVFGKMTLNLKKNGNWSIANMWLFWRWAEDNNILNDTCQNFAKKIEILHSVKVKINCYLCSSKQYTLDARQ